MSKEKYIYVPDIPAQMIEQQIKPIRNQILFKPFPSEEKSEHGIFVSEAHREVNNKGTIVAVGRGTAKKPMRLCKGMVGHRVKDWGTEIIKDGELHFLMDDSAIIALEEN